VRINIDTALRDEVRSAVVPADLVEPDLAHLLAFSDLSARILEDARCLHPTSVYRPSKDYVTGHRDKPRQMHCNSARL
jgi:hypothetical protein